jgi:hypothetical protein
VSADTLIRQALDAGVTLFMVDGKVKVRGTPEAVTKMVEPLRRYKEVLLQHFTQALQREIEPPPHPALWRDLDRAYQAHHVNCKFCQAAGRGAVYGKRCAVGMTLWQVYSAWTKDGHEQI